jgi:hypothetical protein
MYEIYALVDRRDGLARYVGCTCRGLKARMSVHWSNAASASGAASMQAALRAWLRPLRHRKRQVKIVCLERVEAPDLADFNEKKWLLALKSVGHPLTNIVVGGYPQVPKIHRRRAGHRINVGLRPSSSNRERARSVGPCARSVCEGRDAQAMHGGAGERLGSTATA